METYVHIQILYQSPHFQSDSFFIERVKNDQVVATYNENRMLC